MVGDQDLPARLDLPQGDAFALELSGLGHQSVGLLEVLDAGRVLMTLCFCHPHLKVRSGLQREPAETPHHRPVVCLQLAVHLLFFIRLLVKVQPLKPPIDVVLLCDGDRALLHVQVVVTPDIVKVPKVPLVNGKHRIQLLADRRIDGLSTSQEQVVHVGQHQSPDLSLQGPEFEDTGVDEVVLHHQRLPLHLQLQVRNVLRELFPPKPWTRREAEHSLLNGDELMGFQTWNPPLRLAEVEIATRRDAVQESSLHVRGADLPVLVE